MTVTIDEKNGIFLLSTGEMSYAFQLAEQGVPVNLYWGRHIDSTGDLPTIPQRQLYRHWGGDLAATLAREITVFGGKFFNDAALKVKFADGYGALELQYQGYRHNDNELHLDFLDATHPLKVTLHYRLHQELLERSCTIVNLGDDPVRLERFDSASWQLPMDVVDMRLTHLAGRWGREATPWRHPVTPGLFVMESRTGLSGPYHVPFFALDEGNADEDSGRVWFGSILWSGNWKITVERDGFEHTCVSGGINNFDSVVELQPGEEFPLPAFVGGFTCGGFGEMSRIFHRWQVQELLPRNFAHCQMPMISNTWGSLQASVNEENVIRTAENAARIGTELFVIDDGWQRALGDWWADPEKFPRGLRPVQEAVKKLGMKFGLWIEPEAFETKSFLYAQHPDWAMSYPGRPPIINYRGDVERHSGLLNLAKPEVAEYLYQKIHTLVEETGISYLKLDMNSHFAAPGGSPRLWIDYAKNVDLIFQRLMADFPSLMMENCASGAGRATLQMTKSFARMNRSDNQDALDMLKLHEGFTYLNLPRMAGGACHISDSMAHINGRRTPMKFQAYCGMMGSLACGKPLAKCSEEEIAEIRRYVELYKELRPIVHNGELYRLASAYQKPYAIFQYVLPDKSQAVVFILGAFMQFAEKMPRFRLKGLEPEAQYEVRCYGEEPSTDEYIQAMSQHPPVSGRGAMEVGLQVALMGDYDCRILHLIRKSII